LEVKDVNGNIQNVELENGDEIDLIDEDNEIEEQFVIGGDSLLLNSLFGGGTKQKWAIAAAGIVVLVLTILIYIYYIKNSSAQKLF